MAKYDVTFSCGHSGEVQLIGPTKDRDRKLAWYARSCSCPDCRRVEVAATRQAESVEAADTNARAGLPSLTGTPKQVAWAERIRKETLDRIDAKVKNYVSGAAGRPLQEAVTAGLTSLDDAKARLAAVQDAAAVAADELRNERNASWWIDNRDDPIGPLCLAIGKAAKAEVGDLTAKLDAIKVEAAEKARAERETVEAAARAEAEKARMETTVKARTFRVADRPDVTPVEVDGSNILVRSTDGRIARGFIDCGDWVIFSIGDHECTSLHPEMERIARDAKVAWEARS